MTLATWRKGVTSGPTQSQGFSVTNLSRILMWNRLFPFRAKCIKCHLCAVFFSPNKFVFHSHRYRNFLLWIAIYFELIGMAAFLAFFQASWQWQIRSAWCSQLQLLATPHQTPRKPPGRSDLRLGRRQSNVQRRNKKKDDRRRDCVGL